jgi:hypothetical protein
MAFNCLGVSGRALGSLFAAALMALSSSGVGMRTAGRLETFDIVLHLTTIGAAETDDPSHFATVCKRHVVQGVRLRSEGDHSDFVVLQPAVNPHQRGIPVEFDGKG